MNLQIKEQNGLLVHKYKNKVFYDNLWDVLVDNQLSSNIREFRGLVTDTAGNIVSYPFTKIHNYMENGTTIDPDHLVLAFEKINGFMACCSLWDGEVLVSTTGSLVSPFVDMAKEMLPMDKLKEHMLPGYSYCFEICHPDDKHIIEEKVGAYLIGIRKNEIGSKQEFEMLVEFSSNLIGITIPNSVLCEFKEVLNLVKTSKREGYVVYDQESDTVLKLKSPYYLVTKFLARTKKTNIIFSDDYKKYIDEEFYGLCEWIQFTFTKAQWDMLTEQDKLNIVRGYYA
jgi:hypothetical protein